MRESKSKLCALMAAMLFTAASQYSWAQGKIIVSALPSNASPRSGEIIAMPILIDMSAAKYRLGAITTSLQWDTTQMAFTDFAAGTTEGFAGPVVNTQKTAAGKLLFASINAQGAAGHVNVLTLRLQARGDLPAWQGLKLDLLTLASAESFVDLVPLVERVITGIKTAESAAALPARSALFQNIPNPFNPETLIRYELPQRGRVTLTIYNLRGQKVKMLEEGDKAAGRYVARWNGKDEREQNVASGIYFYRLEAQANNGEKFMATRKMSLLR